MFLLNWYKEYLEIRYEKQARIKELQFCQACDTLKLELAVANEERKYLIEKITADKQIPEAIKNEVSNLKPVLPSRINWNVRRQMLESEDRARAQILKKREDSNPKSNPDRELTVRELEKELGVEEG